MTRWLVTGVDGMLGQDVLRSLHAKGADALGCGRRDFDITDDAAVQEAIANCQPDIVINCAAWTEVDAAEAHEAAANLVNGEGPRTIAPACAAIGARMMQVSTDYVFDGSARRPYREDDEPRPQTAYGRSKLAGERAVLELLPQDGIVVRTAWLYGGSGPSFVHTMMHKAVTGEPVSVVADQYGQPSWTVDVAKQLIALAESPGFAGIYHATSSGDTTWHGLARTVFALYGADPDRVKPVPASAFLRSAPRPSYGVLGHDRLSLAGIPPIDHWESSLRRAWPTLLLPAPL